MFAFNMSANLEDPAVATGLEKVLIPISKKGSTKECANHRTTSLISSTSKVMLKILHARLQHYGTKNYQMSRLGLRKEEELGIKLPTSARL